MATPYDAPDEKPSLLDRLSALLTREPEDRDELIALLRGAFERRLLDADALSMIEGVASRPAVVRTVTADWSRSSQRRKTRATTRSAIHC